MAEALRRPVSRSAARERPALAVRGLSVEAGDRTILRRIELQVPRRQVLGVIGPSGVGKSTLLKCLNRLVDLEPGLRVSGDVELDGRSIYAPGLDPDALRTRIGILFQQPVVFPKSIAQNVLFGVRHLRLLPRRAWAERLEVALREASLWREVADRLDRPAAELSVGQQQRLCLARALAVEPEVVLMDEPTSALDPRSTEAIEALILRLKERRTVVLVTHDLAQARRVSDRVACLCLREGAGEVLESACCPDLFADPRCREALRDLEREATP